MYERGLLGSVRINGIYTEYYECKNKGCDRIVKSTPYCCFSCAEAHHGSYEIDMHSALCDNRQIEYKTILGIP